MISVNDMLKNAGETKTMICQKCGAQLAAGNKYCSCCGCKAVVLEQNVFCSKCGKELPVESRFCLYCGNKIVPSGQEENDAAEDVKKVTRGKRNHDNVIKSDTVELLHIAYEDSAMDYVENLECNPEDAFDFHKIWSQISSKIQIYNKKIIFENVIFDMSNYCFWFDECVEEVVFRGSLFVDAKGGTVVQSYTNTKIVFEKCMFYNIESGIVDVSSIFSSNSFGNAGRNYKGSITVNECEFENCYVISSGAAPGMFGSGMLDVITMFPIKIKNSKFNWCLGRQDSAIISDFDNTVVSQCVFTNCFRIVGKSPAFGTEEWFIKKEKMLQNTTRYPRENPIEAPDAPVNIYSLMKEIAEAEELKYCQLFRSEADIKANNQFTNCCKQTP